MQAANLSIQVLVDTDEVAHNFRYLGSTFRSDGVLNAEINLSKLAAMCQNWHSLWRPQKRMGCLIPQFALILKPQSLWLCETIQYVLKA